MILEKPRKPFLMPQVYDEQQIRLQAIVDGIMEIQELCNVSFFFFPRSFILDSDEYNILIGRRWLCRACGHDF